MSLILADVGAEAFLEARFNDSWPSGGANLTLRLFCNNITPTDASTSATFTEAAGGGYSAKTLTAGGWTVSVVSGIYQAAYALQTFTFTGALTTNGTVYGYYVTDAGGILQWAERMTSSVVPAVYGDELEVTPIFQISKGTPT